MTAVQTTSSRLFPGKRMMFFFNSLATHGSWDPPTLQLVLKMFSRRIIWEMRRTIPPPRGLNSSNHIFSQATLFQILYLHVWSVCLFCSSFCPIPPSSPLLLTCPSARGSRPPPPIWAWSSSRFLTVKGNFVCHWTCPVGLLVSVKYLEILYNAELKLNVY